MFEGVAAGEIFDADAMVALSREMIEEAARNGNTVDCRPGRPMHSSGPADVFHTFVYAPMEERIRRVREYYGSAFATPERIDEQDRIRSQYVQHYYAADWRDPHLYDALFCSLLGDYVSLV